MVTRRTLLGSLLACALLLSCAKEMTLPEQPVQETGTYTLTVEARKGERPDTKALGFVETTLKAFWLQGEEVSVYKADALLGTLTAQNDGSSTTLKGEISGNLAKDDELTLKFLSPDYASQDGSIDYISAHCDYAVANVTVTDVEGTSVTTTSAQFENQQAIVKFNLNVSARPLIVTLPKQTITVTPSSARDWLIVAVPAVSSASVFFKATAGEKTYMLNKTGITLEAGKYYNIDVTLSDAIVVHNEAELTAAITNDNAYILFANDISTTSLLEIKESRTITIDMNGFTLNRRCTSRGTQAIVVRTGSKLNLRGGTVTGGWGGNGGALDIEDGTTVNLTDVIITGNTADDRGGEGGNGGIVTINGGYVYAEGGADYGAGIGGGEDGAGADVTINGGIVVVKSGTLGATGLRGIGPGAGSNDYGALTLGDNLMVSSWNGNEGPYPANERKDYCWYRTQARIEHCTHPGYTAETCPYHKH